MAGVSVDEGAEPTGTVVGLYLREREMIDARFVADGDVGANR
jgi:hypothetical protein